MESPGQGKCQGPGSGSGEKPSKAAECLSELNRIIEAQHELLERQRSRITELELQVTELRGRNARVHEEYQRHLRTCTLQQHHTDHHSISTSTLSALTSIQEKPEYCGLSRTVRRHSSLPVETSSSTVSSLSRRTFPCGQWKSTSFSSCSEAVGGTVSSGHCSVFCGCPPEGQ